MRILTGCMILPGTVLGDYSIVTAGSILNGNIIPAGYMTDGKTMWPLPKKFN